MVNFSLFLFVFLKGCPFCSNINHYFLPRSMTTAWWLTSNISLINPTQSALRSFCKLCRFVNFSEQEMELCLNCPIASNPTIATALLKARRLTADFNVFFVLFCFVFLFISLLALFCGLKFACVYYTLHCEKCQSQSYRFHIRCLWNNYFSVFIWIFDDDFRLFLFRKMFLFWKKTFVLTSKIVSNISFTFWKKMW